MIWTPATDATLAGLWAAGLTTSDIADRLGCTKNSVIGRARRLGLPARPNPVRPWNEPRPRTRTLNRLPDEVIDAVHRLAADGMSHADISVMLGVGYETVKQRVRRDAVQIAAVEPDADDGAPWGVYRAPRQLVSDEEMARAYAGRRYGR
jgi:hypothetical protein